MFIICMKCPEVVGLNTVNQFLNVKDEIFFIPAVKVNILCVNILSGLITSGLIKVDLQSWV